MAIELSKSEAIVHLKIVRDRIIEDMAKFASKRSISDTEKRANAHFRRREMAAIDVALTALEK